MVQSWTSWTAVSRYEPIQLLIRITMCVVVVGNSSDNSGSSGKSSNTAPVAGGVSGASALGLIITILGIVLVLLKKCCSHKKKGSGNFPVMLICS